MNADLRLSAFIRGLSITRIHAFNLLKELSAVDDVVQLQLAGARDFVVKPFQAERVLEAVGKALA